jgi:hypothetical protein
VDPNGAALGTLPVRGFPTTRLVDRKARIQYAGERSIYWEGGPRIMPLVNA